MKKDLNWVKNNLEMLVKINSMDNSKFSVTKRETYNHALKFIEQLDESEVSLQVSPVIPKFVAEWIEKHRECESNVWHLMNNVKIQKDYNVELWTWLWSENNADVLARAWLDGYEMEREPKYRVVIGNYVLRKWNNSDTFQMVLKNSQKENIWSECKIELTEKEIKGIDERFWAFAVPVEEEEE